MTTPFAEVPGLADDLDDVALELERRRQSCAAGLGDQAPADAMGSLFAKGVDPPLGLCVADLADIAGVDLAAAVGFDADVALVVPVVAAKAGWSMRLRVLIPATALLILSYKSQMYGKGGLRVICRVTSKRWAVAETSVLCRLWTRPATSQW